MHVCMEQELFHNNWENGRELYNVDYYFFFCFWYTSSILPSFSKMQKWFPFAAKQQLWCVSNVSQHLAGKREWFLTGWSLAGAASPAFPPRRVLSPWAGGSMEVAGGQLTMAWGHSEAVHLLGAQAGHGKPWAWGFQSHPLWRGESMQRCSSEKEQPHHGDFLLEAPSEPLIPGAPCVPFMEHPVEASKENSQAHLCLRSFSLCKFFFFRQKALPCTRMTTRRYLQDKTQISASMLTDVFGAFVTSLMRNKNQNKPNKDAIFVWKFAAITSTSFAA